MGGVRIEFCGIFLGADFGINGGHPAVARRQKRGHSDKEMMIFGKFAPHFMLAPGNDQPQVNDYKKSKEFLVWLLIILCSDSMHDNTPNPGPPPAENHTGWNNYFDSN